MKFSFQLLGVEIVIYDPQKLIISREFMSSLEDNRFSEPFFYDSKLDEKNSCVHLGTKRKNRVRLFDSMY